MYVKEKASFEPSTLGYVPRPAGCFRPGALQFVSPRPGPTGPGSLDAVRTAPRTRWSRLPGGGGDVGQVTSAPPAPEGHRRAPGRPLVPCDHGVTTKGNAPQLCGLGSGRGRVLALQYDLRLVIKLVWHSVNCPRAKQALAGPQGRAR